MPQVIGVPKETAAGEKRVATDAENGARHLALYERLVRGRSRS